MLQPHCITPCLSLFFFSPPFNYAEIICRDLGLYLQNIFPEYRHADYEIYDSSYDLEPCYIKQTDTTSSTATTKNKKNGVVEEIDPEYKEAIIDVPKDLKKLRKDLLRNEGEPSNIRK